MRPYRRRSGWIVAAGIVLHEGRHEGPRLGRRGDGIRERAIDLGLTTLAEGVETTEQMDILRGEHVDQAQGFLLARPLDPETLGSRILVPARPTVPVTIVR